MSDKHLEGIIPPIITPFDALGEVDEPVLRSLRRLNRLGASDVYAARLTLSLPSGCAPGQARLGAAPGLGDLEKDDLV